MISTSDISQLTGHVHDSDGDKVGSIAQVYLDNDTDRPEWVTVKTGMFGSKETFIPLAEATLDGNDLRVPYDKAMIKDAPKVDADGEISPDEEQELYSYYGLSNQGQDSGSGDNRGQQTGQDTDIAAAGTAAAGTAAAGTRHDRDRDATHGTERQGRDDRSDEAGVVGHDTSGPTTDDAMTRSEEQLRVGTETREAGRARLRKHVVTEEQTRTVPVSHEEVRVEREPITDANRPAATDGPDISEEEHEVVLHAERPVVDKETVAVERIKLGTETVRDEETVTEEVRKEQVEVDNPTSTPTGTGDRAEKTTGKHDR